MRLPGTITNSVNSAAENDVELFGIDGLPRFQPIDNFLDLGLSQSIFGAPVSRLDSESL